MTIAMLFGMVACQQEEEIINVTDIEGVPSEIRVFTGEYTKEDLKINASVVPSNATNPGLIYESIDNPAMFVDANGQVSFATSYTSDVHTSGTIRVTSVMNPEVVKECVVYVNEEALAQDADIVLTDRSSKETLGTENNKYYVDLFGGDTFYIGINLKDKFDMTNKYSEMFTFTPASKTDVLTVSEEGCVKIVADPLAGPVEITVTRKDTDIKQVLVVNVNPIRNANELKSFLQCETADPLSDACKKLGGGIEGREAQSYAFIAEDVSDVIAINSFNTKNLDLFGKKVTAKSTETRVLFTVNVNSTLNITNDLVEIDGVIEAGSSTANATLQEMFYVLKNATLSLNGGSYKI